MTCCLPLLVILGNHEYSQLLTGNVKGHFWWWTSPSWLSLTKSTIGPRYVRISSGCSTRFGQKLTDRSVSTVNSKYYTIPRKYDTGPTILVLVYESHPVAPPKSIALASPHRCDIPACTAGHLSRNEFNIPYFYGNLFVPRPWLANF
jgi:hypothetical protein